MRAKYELGKWILQTRPPYASASVATSGSVDFRSSEYQSGHFQRAERLIEVYAAGLGLRTLDALQLSVALDLNADQLIDTVVAADRILCDVARREGLVVIDPENATL